MYQTFWKNIAYHFNNQIFRLGSRHRLVVSKVRRHNFSVHWLTVVILSRQNCPASSTCWHSKCLQGEHFVFSSYFEINVSINFTFRGRRPVFSLKLISYCRNKSIYKSRQQSKAYLVQQILSFELVRWCFNQFLFILLQIKTTLENWWLPSTNLTSEQATRWLCVYTKEKTWLNFGLILQNASLFSVSLLWLIRFEKEKEPYLWLKVAWSLLPITTE